MKRINYASGDLLTDDEIADALMEYARVLAIVGSADVVTFPGVDRGGDLREIQLVVGPASQLLSTSTDEPAVEMDAAAAVEELRRRARRRLPNSLDVGDTRGPSESDAGSAAH
jgi:hypothetical protein